MKYIVINNNSFYENKSLSKLNKKLNTEFQKVDFKSLSNNVYMLIADDTNLDYQRDVNQLQRVFINKLFKKDVTPLITYAILILLAIMILITLTSVKSINSNLIKFMTDVQRVLSTGGTLWLIH